ncbi:hypothetical protein VP424E501_P0236 [Vibrio phage 424E50-1]|nr:hypothetical protein VP424E501_P0236 [Vibrio phage 424E50-1]
MSSPNVPKTYVLRYHRRRVLNFIVFELYKTVKVYSTINSNHYQLRITLI